MAHTEYELREFLPLGKMFQAVIKVRSLQLNAVCLNLWFTRM